MSRLIQLLFLLMIGGIADAHLGNENNTEVRVYADRMQVVVRTSIPLAWKVIGNRAPAMADEAGKAVAKPFLIEAAPGLFEVTAGGRPITPTKADCMFEVQNDVAFVLNYARPVAWPVMLKAMFFESLTDLDSGTVSVFDFTASRFNSDLKPLAEGVIHQGNPTLSFSLGALAPVPAVESAPAVVRPVAEPPPGSRRRVVLLILLLATVAMALIWNPCKRAGQR